VVSALPISVGALLRFQGYESSRVELKPSWNEETTGPQVIRTLCAFANDFQGLNGGYVVIGVTEEGGPTSRPSCCG
jgi:ATP-dependent DNA helicase RecG